MNNNQLMIRPHHIYATEFNGNRMCARMARVWFKLHGLNWSSFVESGLPASAVLATGDELAFMVVETARKMESTQWSAHNGQQ